MLKWLRRQPAEIIVVSGLPRSGTSLMMQMLEAGGLPIIKDNLRPPDASNPRGYYEYEPARRLFQGNHGWLTQAHGKGVKIVSPLLEYLPSELRYGLIFMHRPLDEILRSQAAMLEYTANILPEQAALKKQYGEHLTAIEEWLSQQRNFRILHMDYHQILHRPHPSAAEIAAFCQHDLDAQAMADAVDPRLYHQRETPGST